MMHIVLIALSSAATLGAMAIDFVFGLIKAKREVRHAHLLDTRRPQVKRRNISVRSWCLCL